MLLSIDLYIIKVALYVRLSQEIIIANWSSNEAISVYLFALALLLLAIIILMLIQWSDRIRSRKKLLSVDEESIHISDQENSNLLESPVDSVDYNKFRSEPSSGARFIGSTVDNNKYVYELESPNNKYPTMRVQIDSPDYGQRDNSALDRSPPYNNYTRANNIYQRSISNEINEFNNFPSSSYSAYHQIPPVMHSNVRNNSENEFDYDRSSNQIIHSNMNTNYNTPIIRQRPYQGANPYDENRSSQYDNTLSRPFKNYNSNYMKSSDLL